VASLHPSTSTLPLIPLAAELVVMGPCEYYKGVIKATGAFSLPGAVVLSWRRPATPDSSDCRKGIYFPLGLFLQHRLRRSFSALFLLPSIAGPVGWSPQQPNLEAAVQL
jgi:hypothetical protein